MNATILRIYQKQRRQHYFEPNGIAQGTASACFETAKRIAWSRENWGEFDDNVALSNDGNWRIHILPDEHLGLEDLEGDMFDFKVHGNTVHGGKRTLEAQRKDYISKLERDGVWGYILEKRIPPCDKCGNGERWEHVDSCWGFIGDWDYLREHIEAEVMPQAKGER